MATVVNTHEAKTHLSALLNRALQGEEIIIARAGKPLVRLAPVALPAKPRTFGWAKGEVKIHPEFFDPLPDDLLALFEGRTNPSVDAIETTD